MGRIRLDVRGAVAEIDPDDGGRLASLQVDDLELLGGRGTGAIEYGSFVMAPWAGRIGWGRLTVGSVTHQLPPSHVPPHALHGTVLVRPWQVLERGDTHVTLECALTDPWPWPGRVVQHIELGTTALVQRVEVHATREPFPATVGWHPWFRTRLDRGGRIELAFAAGGRLERGASGLPTGAVVEVGDGPWDDCFVDVRWPVRVTWPGALTLAIDADTTHLVVYNERDEAWCVEPQTGPPDGPNTDPHWVTPDAPLRATTTWTWS